MTRLAWEYGGPGSDSHLVSAGHEQVLVDWAKDVAKSQGECVFLDVGAHVGLYSLNLAEYCAQVHAVEANPVTHDLLRRNIEANADQFPHTTFATYNVAAWDSQTELALFDPNGMEGGGSTRTLESGRGRKVFAQPLDTVLPYDVFPTFVKMDIEGSEAHALRGMRNIIERSVPVFTIEMHDLYLKRPEVRTEVIELFNEFSYVLDDTTTYGEQYYLRAWPT